MAIPPVPAAAGPLGGPATPPSAPAPAPGRHWLVAFVLARPRMLVGLAIVALSVLLAIVGPWLAPYDPRTPTTVFLQSPSSEHLFGTTRSGLDVFSRVLAGARVDITIAVISAFVSFTIGSTLGMLAGLSRSWLGEAISRVSDVVQAFPFVILALLLLAAIGPSIPNIVIVVALVNLPIYLRLLKSQTMQLRDRPFVEAARVSGADRGTLMLRHILPNALAPAYAQLSINIAWAILLTAGVSFLGAGIRAPEAEWGLMISEGASDMVTGNWWVALFPGLTLAMTTFGYALVADGLNDLADPRHRA